MPYKDIHDEPFGASTIAKLEIFEDYAKAWIPTWVMQGTATVGIFDFFAGSGYDNNGVPGSPIRLLIKIKEQIGNIFQKGTNVVVYFNEFEPKKREQKKFELLKIACSEYLSNNPDVDRAITLNLYNEDFETLFPKLVPEISSTPSLVLLDQNGIKALSEKYFLELENTKQTDFLYFVSSSYILRFGELEEFRMHLNMDLELLKESPYTFIHKSILEQLKARLPIDSRLKLYPFSIKKEANIYGIIFGASHPRAVDKFITIAWKRDEVSGEANFDLHGDVKKDQGVLFGEQPLTKIEGFKQRLREKVLAGELKDNFQVFDYCLNEAHLGKHASDELRKMKKEKEIDFDGTSPLVTYEKVYKEKRICKYTILRK